MAAAVCSALFGASTAGAALTFPLQSKWSATLADSPLFPPIYDAGFGYFSLRNGQLVAISLADGKPAWSVQCATSTPPAAGGGLVFTGGDKRIESRSQVSGDLAWMRPTQGRVTSLFWDSGWLMATTDKGPFVAIRAADGELLWQHDLDAALHGTPALAGDRVYLALEDGHIVALSLLTGDLLWTSKLDQVGVGILALEDRLYVGSQDDFLYCLDTRDGERKWRWRNDADVVGTPVIDTRRVYVVALDNLLRALNRGGGSLYWKSSLPMRPSSGPLLSGTLLIVPGFTAELHAYSTVDGNPAGDFVLRGTQSEELQLAAPPHLTSDEVIIIVTKNGQVEALAGSPPAP
ncbi:MAG: PQQ-binding-like beta-propeller repeat protein [Vicinamibacterales bacterium]|nr:PQQ-binding-like beta-propeller repeat protein [Vicinamibacterales bacterium]